MPPVRRRSSVAVASWRGGCNQSLSILEKYSNDWALPINMKKSKIMIFQKKPSSLLTKNMSLKLGKPILNHVTCYNYLGLTISASGQFNTAIKIWQIRHAGLFYSIRRPLIKFNPPIKLWIKIFHSIIKPILCTAVKFWGLKFKLNYDHGTKTLLKYSTLSSAKNILGIHRNAPNLGCRAELGRFPLLSEIQKRAAKFWFHLSDTPTDSYHHSAFTYRQTHPESDPMHYLVEKHQLNCPQFGV